MGANHKLNQTRYFSNLMIVATISIMLVSVSIIYNNSIRSSPIFLFLLALGVGIASGLGLKRGGLLGLLLLSTWITTKQVIGVWSKDNLYLNLLEILLAVAVYVVIGTYYEKLRTHFKEYQTDKNNLRLLDFEDTAIGLIKPAIGLLRLKEETDRALRYRLPLSFIMILIRPKPGLTWSHREGLSAMRAVATTLKDSTRAMDIPFVLSHGKIALILPNTGINGTNKVINNILRQMVSVKTINPDGSVFPLQNHTQLRFGFGTFKGYSDKPVDLMEAAERSLQKNVESNAGNIFQNLFIDWEVLGETASSNTVIAPRSTLVIEMAESIGGNNGKPPFKSNHKNDE